MVVRAIALFDVERVATGADALAAPEPDLSRWDAVVNRIRRPDGTTAYGFVYDAGSDGGSGMNWYREVPLRAR